MHSLLFVFSVHSDSGGRQAGPRPEVGRQRDQVCQRNQGWEDGDGKTACSAGITSVFKRPLKASCSAGRLVYL